MDLHNTQVEATQAPVEVIKLDAIEKAYFASNEIEKAGAAIGTVQEICAANGIAPTYNFDIEKEFNPGYGVIIDQITKRGADGTNVIVGILIGAIPDFASVMKAEHGADFVQDKTISSMVAKLKNAVRPRGEDNTVSASVPFSITDFITSNRPEGILIAFNDLAPAYVKMLKKKGLSLMTVAILRQTLQSAAFASQNFPKISQEKWSTILDSMVAKATKEGKAVGILTEWKATRDSAELVDAEVDLADLDFDAIQV